MKPARSQCADILCRNMTSMPSVIVAPDAFKGTLTAREAADAMALGMHRVLPHAQVRLMPMADGGEGTLEAILTAMPGERRSIMVSDAAGNPLVADYAVLEDGTAVIEIARIVGFTQPGIAATPLARRTTAGVGQLLTHCLDLGIRRYLVGLGGSSTNDGGIGMLTVLGMQVEEQADRLQSVDLSHLDTRLSDCRITLLTDVDNPLCGERGASAVYGPQKGATPDEVPALDARLHRFSRLANPALAAAPGTGAAGGLGYALQLIGGEYCNGAEKLLELMGFDAALQDADWVMTGEGRSDWQTLYGKAPCIVARHARAAGVPVTLISGQIDSGALTALQALFQDCHAIVQGDGDVVTAMENAARLLAERAEQAARLRLQ